MSVTGLVAGSLPDPPGQQKSDHCCADDKDHSLVLYSHCNKGTDSYTFQKHAVSKLQINNMSSGQLQTMLQAVRSLATMMRTCVVVRQEC